MPYVTDAHAFLWFISNDSRLSQNVKKIYEQAKVGNNKIILPTIAFLEILWVVEKTNNIMLSPEKLWTIVKESSWLQIVPLDLLVLEKFIDVSKKLEMHDRIIVATAKLVEASILTLDPEIKKLGGLKTVW